MPEVPFKIYNASAGSGKTHTLTKEYLLIVLSSKDHFKKILAITFTNKAVSEMKTRILDSLFQFSRVSNVSDAPSLFLEIMQELDIDANTLKTRSKNTLKEILHNYAFFDISTIDRFTHRLIRTFAKDLKLPQNFEVILDTDLLLEEAVARLVHKAGTDQKLTQVLVEFALEKIDNDKSWDITYDLTNIGKLLFNENHAQHLEKLKDKDIEDFLGLKKTLRTQIKSIQENLITTATDALRIIDENGLEFSDFKGAYFPKFMAKIAEGDLGIDFNAGWKQNFETTALYNKSTSDRIKSTLDFLHPKFGVIINKIKAEFHQFLLLKNAYGNVVPLTVLNAILHELKTLQEERDQLSITEFNTIISKEIKNQPAPFIYERLGEKYRHYFIDEFQDTSFMQWSNLVPLVGNALESEDLQGTRGTLFLVGDAKQAIYRWRGGRAEQFLNLVNANTNPFVVQPKIEPLPINWRSHEEIIKFNNDFFTSTSPKLNSALYNALFVAGNQQGYNTKKGGFVQLAFIESDDQKEKAEVYCDQVLTTIEEVVEKQYSFDQICILVRSNKEGVVLADFLTQKEIPIISSESLLLNNSETVRFLVDVLKLAAEPQNLQIAFEILLFLSSWKKNRHQFIHENLHQVEIFLRNEYGFHCESIKRSSAYDGIEEIIKQFDLVPESDAYVTYFMDVVLEVEQMEGTGIQEFLTYWEKKKEKLSITAPEKVNAVRIMTIHKAKGLEFPIVIFPFANANIYNRNDKKLWLTVDEAEFNGFEEILVNEKKEVAEYSIQAAESYMEEEHKMELDAFNVLYVALTRAERALYVISEKDLTTRGEHKPEFYSGLFIEFLKKKGLWNEERTIYAFGKLEENEKQSVKTHQEQIQFHYTFKNRPEFRIVTKSGMLWDTTREEALSKGSRLHHILGLIESENDVENALKTGLRNGDLAEEEIEEMRMAINRVIDHPELRRHFTKGSIVKNEKDIITKDGAVLRPDRVMLNGNRVTLIDYKTGKSDSRYKEQLYAYSDALSEMGYTVENKILVYINEAITTQYV